MIYVLSGGGKKAVAAIVVTFPAGSKVTATADGQTPRTYNDSTAQTGKWFIPLAAGELGTWTVNCTDGTQSAPPTTVSIIAEGQVETVEMVYGLWIIKNGVIQDIGLSTQLRTGSGKSMTVTQISEALSFVAPNNIQAGIAANEKIDISEYKTLYCKGTATQNSSFRFGLFTGTSSSVPAPVSSTLIPTTYTEIPKLDLTAVTSDTYYVGINGYANTGSATATITDFWLG